MNTAIFVSNMVTFILGIIVGWVSHALVKNSINLTEENSKSVLLLCVAAIWVISMLVSIVNPAYQVPIPVHGIMGAIVGFFFYKPGKDK